MNSQIKKLFLLRLNKKIFRQTNVELNYLLKVLNLYSLLYKLLLFFLINILCL